MENQPLRSWENTLNGTILGREFEYFLIFWKHQRETIAEFSFHSEMNIFSDIKKKETTGLSTKILNLK